MLKDQCGGNFKYVNGIKDCSACTVTHLENAYEHVMSKMGLIMSKAKLEDK
jgi:Zn-finger protein